MSTNVSSPDAKSKCFQETLQSDSMHLFDALRKGKLHLTRFILAAASTSLHNSVDVNGYTTLIACCDIKVWGYMSAI